jgi:hypothetical protein
LINTKESDPDPGSQLITDPPDLNPQHCHKENQILPAVVLLAKLFLYFLAGGDCPAYKGGGRKCRGKLKDFVLDWEAALPEEDLEISDAQSKMADLRYISVHNFVFSI